MLLQSLLQRRQPEIVVVVATADWLALFLRGGDALQQLTQALKAH